MKYITAIRADARGEDCTVQFGNGTDTLDIGSNTSAIFESAENSPWGKVTITGKITERRRGPSGTVVIGSVATSSTL